MGVFTNDRLCRQAFRQILDGVAYIHEQGYVNRDIKVENIFVDQSGKIKIGDLGFCKLTQNNELIDGDVGSERYKAPEIIERANYCGVPADIFALGVVLYTMRSILFPFEACTMRDGAADLLQSMGPQTKFYVYYFNNG